MKVLLCYFSGTGNTKKIVDKYVDEFKKRNIDIDVWNIEKKDQKFDAKNYDMLGIAYPIYAFNAPSIVVDFVKNIAKQDKKKKLFIIKSSGEPLAINNISSNKIKNLLKRKNFILTNEYHYVMPYNIMFRHTDNMAFKMWDTAKKVIPVDCDEIVKNKESKLSYIFMGNLIAWIFRIQYWGGRYNGKKYEVNEKCIKCKKCANCCPVNNIKIENDKFVFGDRCIMCMRCSFCCPADAFKIGLFNKWKVNGQYNFNNYNENEIQTHINFCKNSYKKYFDRCDKKIGEYNDRQGVSQ